MRYLAIILTLLFIAAPVGAFSRASSGTMHGQIDMVSVHGSAIGETVLQVKGDGKVNYSQDFRAGEDYFYHDMEVDFLSDGNYFRPLVVTAGVMLNDDEPQLYVVRAAPEGETGGRIEQLVEVEIDQWRALQLDNYSQLIAGVYQRHIDLKHEDISLREVLKIIGGGTLKDVIRIEPPETEQ